MSDELTGDKLRAHAKAERTVAWDSQARQLLTWAADLIDAADSLRRAAPVPADALMDAVNMAARDLPDDAEIRIGVENGAGWVEWSNSGMSAWNVIDDPELTLTGKVYAALCAAASTPNKGTTS